MKIRFWDHGSAAHAPDRTCIDLEPATSRADIGAPPVATDGRGSRMLYRLRALLRIHSDLAAQEGEPAPKADVDFASAPQGKQTNELEIRLKNRSLKMTSTASETSMVGILGSMKRSALSGIALALLAAVLLHGMMPVWGTVATSTAIFAIFACALPAAAYQIAKRHRVVNPP
ncbi:hypothetical protein ACFV2Q_38390 [Streptomyces sp. NPDC059650]|uniref:hypothetical protein n=1 Tax=Streptomyces sp. NPDC059650 TaxID=3346896 RepID=UPI0036790EF8